MNPKREIYMLISILLLAHIAFASSENRSANRAQRVTIYRDRFGTPHIYGKSDADVVFGVAYAQAEDNFWQIEDSYVRALGRACEIYGEKELNNDLLNREMEVAQRSQTEYKTLEPRLKSLVDAYAEGLNFYLAKNPTVKTRLIFRFEGWHVLAYYNQMWFVSGLAAQAGLQPEELNVARRAHGDNGGDDRTGSNGWAIAPSRSKSGAAMLFLNPHNGYFGGQLPYELHVHSEMGWNFSGVNLVGSILPDLGHNENLGWTFTDNYPDIADLYAETFDDAKNPLHYRYGANFRTATEWTDTIKIKTATGFAERKVTLRKTHHGVIIARRSGSPLAVRVAGYAEQGGAGFLRQIYQMNKARSLSEFKRALAVRGVPFMNVTYADRAGNIFYVYAGDIPRRAGRFDWENPVDGANPLTEWSGFYKIEELPQVLNPKIGFTQNCNSSPFVTTATMDDPHRADFPSYIGREQDNARARRSRQLLSSHEKISFEDLASFAFDTTVGEAERELPALFNEFERLKKTDAPRAAKLQAAIDDLKDWNRISATDSDEMTIFNYWLRRLHPELTVPPFFISNPTRENKPGERIKALENALVDIENEFGTTRVAWGERTRLQRYNEAAGATYDDAKPSLPVAGASGINGTIFNLGVAPQENRKRRYGNLGASYVAVFEFGKDEIRALSINVFGVSADSNSKHFFDQAPLFARGEFKPAWFLLSEIKANLELAYHPGEEKAGKDE